MTSQSLQQVFEEMISGNRFEGFLFLPKGEEWTLDSRAYFLELLEVPPEEDDDDEKEIPEQARKDNMRPTLYDGDVLGIVLNAKAQKPDVTIEELFDAFMYYWEHDAFKDFGSLYTA